MAMAIVIDSADGERRKNRGIDIGFRADYNGSMVTNAVTRDMKRIYCQGKRREPALTSPARRAWTPGAPEYRASLAEATTVGEIASHQERGMYYEIFKDKSG